MNVEVTPLPGIGVRKDVHERFGGFDESMDALFDVDYCIRLQLGGIELRLVPEAREQRHAPQGVDLRFH